MLLFGIILVKSGPVGRALSALVRPISLPWRSGAQAYAVSLPDHLYYFQKSDVSCFTFSAGCSICKTALSARPVAGAVDFVR